MMARMLFLLGLVCFCLVGCGDSQVTSSESDSDVAAASDEGSLMKEGSDNSADDPQPPEGEGGESAEGDAGEGDTAEGS